MTKERSLMDFGWRRMSLSPEQTASALSADQEFVFNHVRYDVLRNNSRLLIKELDVFGCLESTIKRRLKIKKSK